MHPSGPSSNLTGVLMRRRNLDRERHPCDGHTQRKGWVGTQQAQGKGFRRNLAFPHLDLGLPASRKWCEKTNFCRVSHSVSGVLFWQPQQTDTSVSTLLSSDRPKASHCITSRSWSSYKDLQGLYHPAFTAFLLLYSSSPLPCSFCSSLSTDPSKQQSHSVLRAFLLSGISTEKPMPQIPAWLTPSSPSVSYSSLATLSKGALVLPHRWGPPLSGFPFLFSTYHYQHTFNVIFKFFASHASMKSPRGWVLCLPWSLLKLQSLNRVLYVVHAQYLFFEWMNYFLVWYNWHITY